MRKWLVFSVVIFVLLLGACSNYTLKPDENSLILSFKNNSQFDFYTLEITTGLYTTGISYADGSKIKKGELLQFEIVDQKDMNLEGEATFQFAIINKEGKFPLNNVSLELATNREYTFEISGDAINDAELRRIK